MKSAPASDWSLVSPDKRYGLTYEDYLALGDKFGTIIAMPIMRAGSYVGCVTLDLPPGARLKGPERAEGFLVRTAGLVSELPRTRSTSSYPRPHASWSYAIDDRSISREAEESVKVKCFGCDALIEADDSDAVADAFVAHGQESHTWSYPEEAIRNYARNYAEATERLTGSTERLSEVADITVHPITRDRIDDWLRFFDRDAFAGNPDWASCYCLEPHVPATPERPERAWRETRATVTERLRGGPTFGYLAYVGRRPAGWVNASLRSDYGLYRHVDPDGPAPTSVIGVSCFVIAPPFRRHGIASALLDRVIADASARGARWIEGYPLNKPDENDAGHFRGPRSMYDARGFEPIEVRERDTVVRLSAIPARL